jgi:hypothetical protein
MIITDKMRLYKEKLVQENQLLEHYKEHIRRPEPQQCKHCRIMAKDTFTLEDEARLVEIDVFCEAVDVAIDQKNGIITGHFVNQVTIYTRYFILIYLRKPYYKL